MYMWSASNTSDVIDKNSHTAPLVPFNTSWNKKIENAKKRSWKHNDTHNREYGSTKQPESFDDGSKAEAIHKL